MLETTITLMGVGVWIRYQIHEEGYIEWELFAANKNNDEQTEACLELLDTVLRITHIPYIEATIREHFHWHNEERARAHALDTDDITWDI